MNNTIKLGLIGLTVFLVYKYVKKQKEEKIEEVSIEKVSDETLSPSELDQIRINLLDYIEARNRYEGIEKPREDIDHDIMLITTVKK